MGDSLTLAPARVLRPTRAWRTVSFDICCLREAKWKGRRTRLQSLGTREAIMKKADRRSTLALGMAAALLSVGSTMAAGLQDDAQAMFERFVAAQNAHDASAVEAMLWDSPD